MERAFNPILGRESPVALTPFGRDGWRLVRCRETDFVFLPNPPAYDALAVDHAWESTYLQERERRAKEDPLFFALGRVGTTLRGALVPRRNPFATLLARCLRARAGRTAATVVDVGCADARFTCRVAEAVARKGLTARFVGIEVSNALASAAGANLAPLGGSAVRASAIDGMRTMADGSVAAVLMSSFLEHEARPLDLLSEVRRALAVGGAALVKVPNFACWNKALRGARWCGFRYPDHVNYFTPRTLRLLAERAGLACEQPLSMRMPTSDNMYALLRRPAP
ncbi:MAG: class I SAM-dependent methyltransferase [bacterium]